MTRNNYLFAALCLLAGGLASCSSNIDDELPANDTWTLNVMATKSDTPATRALSYDGSKITATWKKDETVDVRANLESVSQGKLYAQSNGVTVNLRGTITGTGFSATAPDESRLSLWFPDYRGSNAYLDQNGTLENIATNFDYAYATVKVTSVDASNHVLTTTNATFVNAQAIVKFTLYDNNGTPEVTTDDTPISVSELHVYNGSTEIADATLSSANNVVWMAIPEVSDVTINLTATVGGNTYNYTKTGVTFAKGHFYPITVKMTLVP